MDKGWKLVGKVLILLTLTSCLRSKVGKNDSIEGEGKYKYSTIFLSNHGDTIIQVHHNFNPSKYFHGVEWKTSENRTEFFITLDSLEYLEVFENSDIASTITWEIRRR